MLVALWGSGTIILMLRLLIALLRLRRLERASRTAMLGGVSVRVSEQVQTPLTWGIRRSVILLPAALLSGDRAVCDSALRHEQAHIARWDWRWNLLAEIVCAFCWFQPGAWWLRSRMKLESERACDDRVLLSGVAGPDYADHLVQILRSIGSNEVAPAMARSGEMEERMRHILDGSKARCITTTWLIVSAPVGLALLSLAALRVSARPAEAKLPSDREAAAMKSRNATSRTWKATDPAEKPATSNGVGGPPAYPSSGGIVENVTRSNAVEPAGKEKQGKESSIAWGKKVAGLQAGVSIRNQNDIQLGGKARAIVRLRNVSNETITASVWPLWTSGPRVVDTLGERVRSTSSPEPLFEIIPEKITLKPGQTVVAGETDFSVEDAEARDQPFPEGVVGQFTIHVRPGSYKVDFFGLVQEHQTLRTGTVDFRVKH